MVERRNKLMKDLNMLRETNKVYEAIDAEIYNSDVCDSEENASDVRHI